MNLELTLEDCRNLLESEQVGQSCVILAAMHDQNPFDKIPDEKIREYHKSWAKIRNFVKENEK